MAFKLAFFRQKSSPTAQYILKTFGITPRNVELYEEALTHKSLSSATHANNERLEYLGDAILGAVVADHLCRLYPNREEGFLTEMRSKIVNRNSLNNLANKLNIREHVEYDRSNHNVYKSIGGNALEAIIGAIYIDRGYEKTRAVIINHIITPHIDISALENTEYNFKSKLIDIMQRTRRNVNFELVRTFYQSVNGNSVPTYTVKAVIDGHVYGRGTDFTIKGAEQKAAESTLKDKDFIATCNLGEQH